MEHVVKGCGTEEECKIPFDISLPFNQYIADGKTKKYLFNFVLLNPNYLAVYATAPNAQASPCDKLVLNTDYIIDYYDVDGGAIELAKTYEKGYIITLTLESNYNLDTRFNDARAFSGAEFDLIFRQISLYFKELMLLFNTTLKFPINSVVKPISTYLPELKDDYVWVGKNKHIIQVPLPTGGKSDCCEVLKTELADNTEGVDGARMIGLYNKINNIQTNVSIVINEILNKLDNITTVPKPKPDEKFLSLSNDKNGKVFWDKSVIGSVYTYLNKIYANDTKGLLYLDGTGYYPFETSDEGIPYSRLANIWWNNNDDRYEFGGAWDSYYAATFPNLESILLLINSPIIEPNVVYENVDLNTYQEYNPSTMACSQIIDGNRLEVYERAACTGEFSDNGTGIKFEVQEYTAGAKGNSGIIDLNEAKIQYVGGEYFTFFGIRVYYVVDGKGKVPPKPSYIRRLVKVNLPVEHTLGEVEFFTKHALLGTGLYALNPNFRENAVFSLKSPDLKVYLKSGTSPNEYTRDNITLYIPNDKPIAERVRLIKAGINRYSFSVPDARDLHLRGSDAAQLDTNLAWRNIEARKKFRLQYGGICISDIVKKHKHTFEKASSIAQGPIIINTEGGGFQLYSVKDNTSDFGGMENRVAAMEVYFYVKY